MNSIKPNNTAEMMGFVKAIIHECIGEWNDPNQAPNILIKKDDKSFTINLSITDKIDKFGQPNDFFFKDGVQWLYEEPLENFVDELKDFLHQINDIEIEYKNNN